MQVRQGGEERSEHVTRGRFEFGLGAVQGLHGGEDVARPLRTFAGLAQGSPAERLAEVAVARELRGDRNRPGPGVVGSDGRRAGAGERAAARRVGRRRPMCPTGNRGGHCGRRASGDHCPIQPRIVASPLGIASGCPGCRQRVRRNGKVAKADSGEGFNQGARYT